MIIFEIVPENCNTTGLSPNPPLYLQLHDVILEHCITKGTHYFSFATCWQCYYYFHCLCFCLNFQLSSTESQVLPLLVFNECHLHMLVETSAISADSHVFSGLLSWFRKQLGVNKRKESTYT